MQGILYGEEELEAAALFFHSAERGKGSQRKKEEPGRCGQPDGWSSLWASGTEGYDCIQQQQLYPFFIIGPAMEIADDADKITLVLSVRHEPGALYHVLGYFFYGGMNMTHLESRPIKGKPFEYFFHIDVTGRLKDPANAQTLKGIESMSTYFKILGNYPSYSHKEES